MTPSTCPTCRASLRQGAHFCPSCGSAVATEPPPSVPAKGKAMAAKGAAGPTPAPEPASPGPAATGDSRRTVALLAGLGVVVLLLVLAIAALATRGSGDDEAATSDTTTTTPANPAALPPATTAPPGADGSAGGAGGGSSADGGPAASVASGPLQPVSAVASNIRAGVNLRCPPHNFISYDPSLLIDGNENTGWGASSSDGTGESITVSFANERHLTSVGLTPGYTKFGPRADQNCAAVSAFPFNRFVTAVEYRFDDGSVVRQDFQQTPGMQTIPVDEVTRSVTITILGTVRPTNADDDTIISEAAFEGFVP